MGSGVGAASLLVAATTPNPIAASAAVANAIDRILIVSRPPQLCAKTKAARGAASTVQKARPASSSAATAPQPVYPAASLGNPLRPSPARPKRAALIAASVGSGRGPQNPFRS